MVTERSSHFSIEFIDPLFAVAVHIGLTESLFKESWFHDWRLPQGDELIRLATFCLGLLTLLLAWVGYHESIKHRPIKAFGRFIVDVLIVILYAMLLVKSADFDAMLFLLVVIYMLYVFWSVLKSWEYQEEYAQIPGWKTRYRREIVTFFWFLVFLGLWLLLHFQLATELTVIVLAYVCTVGHRINKEVPIWGALGNGISRLFVRGTSGTNTG
jgi:hypothetical protein